MKHCEEYAALLGAFADGEVTESERQEILAHLESCEGCREYLVQIMEMKEGFSCDVPEMPENFASQVMWRVRSEKTKKQKKNRRVMTAVASIAACLVLVLAIPQVLGNMGATMEDAAENGVLVQDSLAGSGAENDPMADSAMPEASEEDDAVGTPPMNDTASDLIYDQDTEAAKVEYPTVTVEQALMDEWLDQGDFSALRAESAEGEGEYYIDAAEYEEFALFMTEKGVFVPELGSSDFLVAYIR